MTKNSLWKGLALASVACMIMAFVLESPWLVAVSLAELAGAWWYMLADTK